MLNIKYSTLFVLLFSTLVLHAQGKKYAFLLGIEEYYPSSNLSDLKSVENDLFYMKFVLETQGFDCVVLNANGLSKKTIFNQLNKSLLEKVQASDIALFYFTGHGTQIFDYDSDECDDNLDEAIVLSTFNETNPTSDQYILDDEINDVINPIRKKLGDSGQMVLIFDACHSGSFSRGDSEDVVGSVSNLKIDHTIGSMRFSISNCVDENPRQEGFASLVGLYSSSNSDKSFEFGEGDKKFGVFTYALIERLRYCDKDYTYSDWIAHIELFMSDKFATTQKPSTEGNLDQLIWQDGVNTKPFPQGVFFKKDKQKNLLSPAVTLTRGGRLIVYPKGTVDTSNIEPSAIILQENLIFKADGSIELSEVDAEKIGDQDVFFIDNQNKISERINVFFDQEIYKDTDELRQIFSASDLVFCTEQKEYADLIFSVRKQRSEQILELRTKQGILIANKKDFKKYPSLIIYQHFQRKIISFNNLSRLKALEKHSDLDVELSVDKVDKGGRLIATNTNEFVLGDYMDLRIKNINDNPVFVYVYFVDNEFNIGQLFPKQEKLSPQQETTLNSICELVRPIGTDQLKIIVSSKAINHDIYLPSQNLEDRPLDYIFSNFSLNKPIIYNLEDILDTELFSFRSKEIIVND